VTNTESAICGETGSAVTGNPGTPCDEHRAIFVSAAGSAPLERRDAASELVTPKYDGLPVLLLRGRGLGTVAEPAEQAKGALAEHVAAELGAAEDDEDHGELDPGQNRAQHRVKHQQPGGRPHGHDPGPQGPPGHPFARRR
jgi:hypothetical protein